MATATNDAAIANNGTTSGLNKEYNGHRHDGNPLVHSHTADSSRLPAFGGEFQPGLYRDIAHRKFANPAPLGLCAFALTTFILSLINMQANHVTHANVVVSCAYAYGGLVQLLAGMWEMAVGNTFGATALSSYGGFWISFAIIETPSFAIVAAYNAKDGGVEVNTALGFYLFGWWIFTTLLLLCTLRSTVAFFLLFFTLDLAFLFLAIGRFYPTKAGAPHVNLTKTGGFFGLLAAFLAWYNALAGIADSSNSFFVPGVIHFPWSEKARVAKAESATV